ncbi:MAG: uroporphyrinogen-III C-methyltransferase [Burkholderiaceae bacterium]|nr:uroporphyrinogen-III C-methyltransferase [Burkholderiaceae bacterium]
MAALVLAWSTQQRIKSLEQDLVRRQADSQAQAAEARALARAAQDLARESAAKGALLEARVAEASMQRSQIEDLLSSVSRSRDENVVADVEAAIRVALQQSALTGSAEPLVATLKQSDERLARYNQPRLERVRRAVNRDLDRVKALGVVDIGSLTVRLDEAVRLVDELPLLALAEPRGKAAAAARPTAAASAAASAVAGTAGTDWRGRALQWWQDAGSQVGNEIRSLVRVTRIDRPEAMLVAPEQQFFVRENLKLRLLNARLALLSRQFEIAQSDMRAAQSALDRYFDRGSKRAIALTDLLRQVSAQARQTGVPRPDETLAALATAAAGR